MTLNGCCRSLICSNGAIEPPDVASAAAAAVVVVAVVAGAVAASDDAVAMHASDMNADDADPLAVVHSMVVHRLITVRQYVISTLDW